MKMLLKAFAVLACTFCIQAGYAADNMPMYQNTQTYQGQGQGQGDDSGACCPADHPHPDSPAGECWCLYIHYKPCYYNTRRCVEEKIPCTKRCCRMVDQYYQVERCRMVPEKYCETCCRKCPEYYDVPDCKTCYKWVCDQHCQYVPQYYWKHSCGETTACTAQPTACPTYQPRGQSMQ
jgi:hypothetical protein